MTRIKFIVAHWMLARAYRAERKARELKEAAEKLFQAVKGAK